MYLTQRNGTSIGAPTGECNSKNTIGRINSVVTLKS